MENFMLWGVATSDGGDALSFFATRMQLPCIARGTREMIDQMLVDLGIPGTAYAAWTLSHFRTNYFTAPDEPLASADTWMDTWEIRLALQSPAPPSITRINERTDILRTFARDATWDGSEPPSLAPHSFIAHFFHPALFTRAELALAEAQFPHNYQEPEVDDLVEALRHDPCAKQLATTRRSAGLLELCVSLGIGDPAWLQTHGAFIAKVAELIRELGGQPTWNETVDMLVAQGRYTSEQQV